MSQRAVERELSVAVVVISHNYGHWLAECLNSVLAQTRRPDKIIVIDDGSEDDTQEVARQFADQGVVYHHIDEGHVHRSRQAGWEATRSSVLMFLDADDWIAPDYLEQGLAGFDDHRIAVVYSDVEYEGDRTGQSKHPRQFDRDRFQQKNYLHAGSLVRRVALDQSRAFDLIFDATKVHGDWFLWRHVLRGHWTAAWQPGLYHYRRHDASTTSGMSRQGLPRYFDSAGLRYETVTLFMPLSGRKWAWEAQSKFLERQQWSHHQVRLVLLDTSQDESFSSSIRTWLSGCDYPDVRHIQMSVARPGLADANRRNGNVRREVEQVMPLIYNRVLDVAESEYIWVVEDDVLPPDDACRKLLEAIDEETVSVSGAYRSRYHGDFVAWKRSGKCLSQAGTGVGQVGGHGFGCAVFRRSVLKNYVFSPSADARDFDIALFQRLRRSRFQARVNWDVNCRHLVAQRVPQAVTGCTCVEPGYCDRHQCDKPAHWHSRCQTHQEYFDLWERGQGPGQSPNATEEPHLLRKAANFGKAVVRHVANSGRKVNRATHEARLDTCRQCSFCHIRRMVCRHQQCGCVLTTKAWWESETCPEGLWPDIEQRDE